VEEGAVDETCPDQLLLFPLDMKTRERFGELALTFEICSHKMRDAEGFLTRIRNLRFLRYELFAFARSYRSEEEWAPVIETMMGISRGERFDTEAYLNLIETFTAVADKALHLTRSGRGCF
jgi:hypothetical protein